MKLFIKQVIYVLRFLLMAFVCYVSFTIYTLLIPHKGFGN